jgi:thioredoxin-related protein
MATAADWETDFAKAKTQAERQGRFLLVDFSGSDWCGWCKKLDREVFSQNDFKEYAKDNLMLVLIDFPRNEKRPAKEAEQNQALAREYKVRGYPTVLLLLPNGEEVARTGYQEGGAAQYIEHLKGLLSPYEDRLPTPAGGGRGTRGGGSRR